MSPISPLAVFSGIAERLREIRRADGYSTDAGSRVQLGMQVFDSPPWIGIFPQEDAVLKPPTPDGLTQLRFPVIIEAAAALDGDSMDALSPAWALRDDICTALFGPGMSIGPEGAQAVLSYSGSAVLGRKEGTVEIILQVKLDVDLIHNLRTPRGV
jgi:hypothetical protein